MSALPALTEHKLARLSTFTLLYVAQGVPYGFLIVAWPAYLAERGATPEAIGAFIATILLPWSFKLINGPLMDRFTLRAMGRRRPWVLGAQTLLVLSMAATALVPDPVNQLGLLAAFGFAVNLATAFQDVAVDGLAIDVTPLEEQALANGFMWGGRTVGLALSTSATARLMDGAGFSAAALACAAVLALVMLIPLTLRERPGEKLLPWTAGEAQLVEGAEAPSSFMAIVRNLLGAVFLPASVLVCASIFTYSLADGLWRSTLPVLAVQELGWDDTWYADVTAIAGMGGGVFGMLLGGWLVERVGRVRAMGGTMLLLLIVAGGVAAGAGLWADERFLSAAVFVWRLVQVITAISFFATAMALCWRRVSATQYALYMAVSNLGTSAGAALLGPLHKSLSFPQLFVVMVGCLAVGMAFLFAVDIQRHQERLAVLDAA
ncbi:MAG: MFS transporter [Alphaproteobacteria bacterium]|nr:MFS transporter [Alphaproteobacteria bacterium]